MADQLGAEEDMDSQLALFGGEAELRMVLAGKTGAGKSASGNTILGRKAFHSSACSSSITSECQKEIGVFEGQTLAVVDTPGLFDTLTSEDHIKKEIAKCVCFAAPGPHVFLIVIQPNRFTTEEEEAVRMIQEMFGEEAADYTMALFTHGDDLRVNGVSIETFIDGNQALRNFIRQCKGGYHVFDNRSEDVSQVTELLNKINRMVQQNGGKYYTTNMFRKAERDIRQAADSLLKENPGMKTEEARRQAELSYAWGITTSTLTITGAAIGGLVGPVGSVTGAVIGAAAGLTAATLAKKGCIMQ